MAGSVLEKWSALLKSPSLPTTVFFLIISCFLDLTMADVLSVSLLKKAGCWVGLGGERDTMLGQREKKSEVRMWMTEYKYMHTLGYAPVFQDNYKTSTEDPKESTRREQQLVKTRLGWAKASGPHQVRLGQGIRTTPD